MVTILLIADQDRLERLFDFTRESSQIGFRVSRSLRQGILDIAEAPPAVLFIQNHLSGLSGEIIARHLAAEIAGKRPKVALFSEGSRCTPVPGSVDACLDLALSNEELTAAIIGLISEGTDALAENGAPSPVVTSAEETATLASVVEDRSELTHFSAADLSASATEPPAKPDLSSAAPSAPEPVSQEKGTSPFDRTLKTALDDTPPPVPLAELEDTVALSRPAEEAGNRSDTSNGELRSRGRASTRQFRPYLPAAGILAAGALLFFLITPEEKPTLPSKVAPNKPSTTDAARTSVAPAPPAALPTQPATTVKTDAPPAPTAKPDGRAASVQPATQPPAVPPSATPAAKGLAKLPAFIPRDGIDKGYGASHPGWERYRGARTEFKVYRQNETIMAVQTIDRSGLGIPESFLRGALAQVTGGRDYTVQTRETQGKFHVEKGTAASGTRIVIYRSAPKGSIKAFVVHFN